VVFVGRNNPVSIRAEDHSGDRLIVPLEHEQGIAADGVPEANGPVFPGRCQPISVRTVRYPRDPPSMTPQNQPETRLRGVPHPDRQIGACPSQLAGIGAKRQSGDVTVEDGDDFEQAAGLAVAEMDFLRSIRGDYATIGTEGHDGCAVQVFEVDRKLVRPVASLMSLGSGAFLPKGADARHRSRGPIP
jgi:hypothetical protein